MTATTSRPARAWIISATSAWRTREFSVGNRDIVTNFDANNDAFVFGPAVGLVTAINFIDSNPFTNTGVSQARIDTSGPQPMLQIDVDGDGQMTVNDMIIELHNQMGVLHSLNFLLG